VKQAKKSQALNIESAPVHHTTPATGHCAAELRSRSITSLEGRDQVSASLNLQNGPSADGAFSL